jgi:hypothetical protein
MLMETYKIAWRRHHVSVTSALDPLSTSASGHTRPAGSDRPRRQDQPWTEDAIDGVLPMLQSHHGLDLLRVERGLIGSWIVGLDPATRIVPLAARVGP